VRTALGSKLDLDYEDLGEQRVKNIAEPVKTYRIRGIGSKPCAGAPDVSLGMPEKPSIVVLPFRNVSQDAKNEYFVDGITEEIMNGLSRFREILVAARVSAFEVNAQTTEAGEAAKKLEVQYALSGSVRRAGERIRIIASLVEAGSGHQLWSEQYDRVLDDVFDVQDEVATKIVNMLVGNIERTDLERSLRKETDDLTAYEYVLRGRHYWGDWKGSEDDNRRARKMFERAIELDPRYGAAHAGLAATYHQDCKFGWTDDPEGDVEQCVRLARKAIELDEHDSFAHLVLSSAYWRFKGNFELARSQLEAAINLNPNYYWNYCYGCWFSVCSGDLETSVAHGREAMRRNPLLPDGCLHSLGFTEYLAGRYENAIATIGQITEIDPESYAVLAASYAQLGRVDEAQKVASECVDHEGECARDVAAWRDFWNDFVYFRDQTPVDHLIEGLDKAGLVKH
jgi:adenylate cyclase